MIKTVIITDPMGEETSEEVIHWIYGLTDYPEENFKVLRHDNGIAEETEEALEKADLVIIDYGGMSVYGVHDTAKSQIKFVCEWAENHPSKLLILFTLFTAAIYRDELEEEFGKNENIIPIYSYPWEKDVTKKVFEWLKTLDK